MQAAWLAKREGDLGRKQHVRKILDGAFRGLLWAGNSAKWSDRKVSVTIRPHDAERCEWVEFDIAAEDEVDLSSHLGGRFREFMRRRSWMIVTRPEGEPVQFPLPKARRRSPRYESVRLNQVPAFKINRSSAGWTVFFVEASPTESADEVLGFVGDAAEPFSNGDFGVVSENTCVQLPSGKRLYGVGFKREYSFIEHALTSMTDSPRMLATFRGDCLLSIRGTAERVESAFVCYEYAPGA